MKQQRNIMNKELLSKIDFITPDLSFQVRCAGYDYKTIAYAARMTRYLYQTNGIKPRLGGFRRKASESDVKRKFFQLCNHHARQHNLRYRGDLAAFLCKQYNVSI